MILVTGATGNVGREVATALSRAGEAVRTTARHGGDVRADLTDPASLQAALDAIERGEIVDAKTIMLLQYVALRETSGARTA